MIRAYRRASGGRLRAAALLGLCGLAATALAGERVGAVLYANGAATAQQPGGDVRFLGKGMEIEQGDTVSTGARGFVILNMVDDGKMTLRPGSELRIDDYAERESTASIALSLLRGGLRSLSGLIAKRRPSSYRLSAGVATIGIRGTEFDVRICEPACAPEVDTAQGRRGSDVEPLAGRVVLLRGAVTAERPGFSARSLDQGGRVYMGDAIETGPGSLVAIAFRDDTRMVVRAGSRLVVDQYVYGSETEAPSGFFRLVRGGLRALTGLIGKRNVRGFRVSTRVATIGIRGTGFDVVADAHCAGDAEVDPETGRPACAHVNVWEGGVEVNGVALETGQTGYVGAVGGDVMVQSETPEFFADGDAPRPDALEVDLEELFGRAPADSGEAGVYVSVYDGETSVATPAGEMIVARGEAARVDPLSGGIARLSGQPLFMLDDPYPLPSKFDSEVESAFDLFGHDLDQLLRRESLECKIN